MDANRTMRLVTRREVLQAGAAFAGGVVWARLFPETLGAAVFPGYAQQPSAPPTDRAAQFRAQMGRNPIQAQKLADNITMLSGPGGSVVLLTGQDGKLLVDTFVSPAWPRLKETLAGFGKGPVRFAVDTHWHFDHADNNAPLHAAGAMVVAHENTKKRLSQPHHLAVLELDFPPSPKAALPQQTFTDTHTLRFNGETVALAHFPPAHTDTDIYVHFPKGNVLHVGDVFFNGMYPYIDGGTGGSINGMIGAANRILSLADKDTKIVCGHGPLGSKADVARFHDMLSTARDRVQKLKSSGKSIDEAIAAKPFSDLDPTWGKGMLDGDTFVRVVYLTL
jgi:cyclase